MDSTLDCYIENTFRLIEQGVLQGNNWPDLHQVIAARKESCSHQGYAINVALPILTCVLAGGEASLAYPLSACWLLYDTASDIFDHIQDRDAAGWPWDNWAPARAMNVGLGLIFTGTICLAQVSSSSETNRLIQERFGETALLSLQSQTMPETGSLEDYFHITIAKSGLIHATVAWAGARLASDDEAILDSVHEYGMATGIMVQLRDDCRDLFGKQGDLLSGKRTLPLLYGLSLKSHPSHGRLDSLLSTPGDLGKEELAEIKHILFDMGVQDYLSALSETYRMKALRTLELFQSPPVDILRSYVRGMTLA